MPEERAVMGESDYSAPTPKVFYIHDDLTDRVRQNHGSDSTTLCLTRALFDLVRRDPGRVVLLTLDDQVPPLIGRGGHRPFDLTLGIGRAGEGIARLVHQQTGWFPDVRRVDIGREEDGRGGYNLISTNGGHWQAQLRGLEKIESLAIVDDTLFSGLTLRTVIRHLPAAAGRRQHAFCLRGASASLPGIAALCPISLGLAAPGRLLHDVSFINATGLVLRAGIRRAGLPPLAFFERPQWMRAWFPGHAEEVIALCRELNRLLEPQLPAPNP